jgi:hypothetical protein
MISASEAKAEVYRLEQKRKICHLDIFGLDWYGVSQAISYL